MENGQLIRMDSTRNQRMRRKNRFNSFQFRFWHFFFLILLLFNSSHRLNRFHFIFKLLSCFFHSVFIFRLFLHFVWDSRILLFCRQFAFHNVNLIVRIHSSCLSSVQKCVEKGAHCKSIEGNDEMERERERG